MDWTTTSTGRSAGVKAYDIPPSIRDKAMELGEQRNENALKRGLNPQRYISQYGDVEVNVQGVLGELMFHMIYPKHGIDIFPENIYASTDHTIHGKKYDLKCRRFPYIYKNYFFDVPLAIRDICEGKEGYIATGINSKPSDPSPLTATKFYIFGMMDIKQVIQYPSKDMGIKYRPVFLVPVVDFSPVVG